MNVLRPLRRILRVVTGPVDEERGYVLLPYRGYGSREEIFVMGRVLRQHTAGKKGYGMANLLTQVAHRLLRRGVPDIEVEFRLDGSRTRTTTDDDGYYRIHMPLEKPPRPERLWHMAQVEVVDAEILAVENVTAEAQVYIPPNTASQLVISDIDDTVMHTGVANKIKTFWRLFAQDADSRVAFPGVAALYDALHKGSTGNELNPLLYVSRGPWGIYEMLDAFFQAHDIPIGPILFLREWNVRLKSPLPRRAEDHKATLIRNMLDLYPDLPVVLIGDSGQHDPEIYADIVREHPNRVKAVYIRDVSKSSSRAREIEKLAAEVSNAGSSIVLADDTYAMARHAAEHGLISDESLTRVLNERITDSEPERRSPRKGPVVMDAPPSGRGEREMSSGKR